MLLRSCPFFPVQVASPLAKEEKGIGSPLDVDIQESGKPHGVQTTSTRREAKEREEAKVFPLPPCPVMATQLGLKAKVANMAHGEQPPADPSCSPGSLDTLAPFQRLQACLPWWQKHATPFVVKLIQEGVEPNFQGNHLHFKRQKKSAEEVQLALEVMSEYVQVGAATEVSLSDTPYLVP